MLSNFVINSWNLPKRQIPIWEFMNMGIMNMGNRCSDFPKIPNNSQNWDMNLPDLQPCRSTPDSVCLINSHKSRVQNWKWTRIEHMHQKGAILACHDHKSNIFINNRSFRIFFDIVYKHIYVPPPYGILNVRWEKPMGQNQETKTDTLKSNVIY